MPSQRCVRLPLQTGGGALSALFWLALVAGGSAIAAGFLVLLLSLMRGEGESTLLAVYRVLIPTVAGLAFGAASLALLRDIRKQRATDVEFDDHELRFVDGDLGGTAIPWSEIESCTITTDRTRSVQATTGRGTTTEYVDQLWLTRRGSSPQLLAESLDPAEKVSLGELGQAILGARQARGGGAEDVRGTEGQVSVIACPACASPVAPVDAAATPCRSCGAVVELDPGTRERIRAAADIGKASERLEEVVERLLDQPPATAANRPLDLLVVLILAVPAAAIVVNVLPAGGLMRGLALLSIGVPLATGTALFGRLAVVERQALRALVAGMSARNPAREGDPPGCRQCGGTLLIRDRHIVAICLFCRAENLLGLDLRPALAVAQSRTYELGKVLAQRRAERRRAVAGLATCAVVTALALLGVAAW